MTPCNLAQNQASANQSCVNHGSLARAKLGLELGKILQTNGSLVATEKVQAVDRLKAHAGPPSFAAPDIIVSALSTEDRASPNITAKERWPPER